MSLIVVYLLQSKPLNVEYLMMDASILLPPTGTPLTGIDFVKRLPCGDVEKTRKVCQHRCLHIQELRALVVTFPAKQILDFLIKRFLFSVR